ncbi:hypothetical protein FOQG_18703, partial [Fusarium oxysporum f. sp. raphani 54005]
FSIYQESRCAVAPAGSYVDENNFTVGEQVDRHIPTLITCSESDSRIPRQLMPS